MTNKQRGPENPLETRLFGVWSIDFKARLLPLLVCRGRGGGWQSWGLHTGRASPSLFPLTMAAATRCPGPQAAAAPLRSSKQGQRRFDLGALPSFDVACLIFLGALVSERWWWWMTTMGEAEESKGGLPCLPSPACQSIYPLCEPATRITDPTRGGSMAAATAVDSRQRGREHCIHCVAWVPRHHHSSIINTIHTGHKGRIGWKAAHHQAAAKRASSSMSPSPDPERRRRSDR